jgi:hypothetical protein
MRIERENNEIKFTIPDDIVDLNEIQSFIDYLKFKELTSKSSGSQSEAEELANDINKSWWDKNKTKFE